MKKKKLLQRDGFYLALFVCICLVAIGGIWFTKNSVDNLASKNGFLDHQNKVSKNDEEGEIHLIKNNDNTVPTSTNSKENLSKAKENEIAKKEETIKLNNKINYLGEKVTRKYSEKTPSYSTTLDVWEIHKALDVQAKKGNKVKSITNGKVLDIFIDDQHGMSVKIESSDKITVVYSNLDSKVLVKKGQKVSEGDTIGKVGNTTMVESLEDSHIHVTATQDGKSIDPMKLIK